MRGSLAVLRAATLTNGVSPLVPLFLCFASCYLWVVGSMARCLLAHSISLASPPDGETDLVSTPIRLILYPKFAAEPHVPRGNEDAGFTQVERNVLNAVWRPITGHCAPTVVLTILLGTWALLWLKPLSTLESGSGTLLLRCGLTLSVFLVGVTIVQVILYWIALHRLLKRTMEHPLGPSFQCIPPFARDSVDHQISRTPDEDLRWTGTARLYCDLVRSLGSAGNLASAKQREEQMVRRSIDLEERRRNVLAAQRDPVQDAMLAELVISTASEMTNLLEDAWDVRDTTEPAALGLNPNASKCEQNAGPNDVPIVDSLTAVEAYFTPMQLKWLRSAQAFVATAVTLLIHRHVRQFRYFLHVTTGCALLLLLTVTSYPFEPYRLLLACIWVVVGMAVGINLWIFLQLDRNTLMSHIAGTTPNSITVNAREAHTNRAALRASSSCGGVSAGFWRARSHIHQSHT